MLHRPTFLLLLASASACLAQARPVPPSETADVPLKGEETAILTDAPHVPPPITRDHPTRVKVELEVTDTVLNGLQGEIVVNGNTYNSIMPSLGLSDESVANVLTYVYSQWDNHATEVTPDRVAAIRAAKK